MYDEFDNKENEDRYDPKQPSAEDEVKTGQMYGEEDQLSETEEVQASTAEETEASAESGEQSSVYHYSYERGEQAEPTGSTQNSQQYGSSEHHAEEHMISNLEHRQIPRSVLKEKVCLLFATKISAETIM